MDNNADTTTVMPASEQVEPKNHIERAGWRGFLPESKLYMNYPNHKPIRFWLRLPGAWMKFKWLSRND